MDKKTTTKFQEAVKKVMRKSTTPKSKIKKGITKKVATNQKRIMVYSDDATSFWLNNGQILNSLIALHDALSAMDKNLYTYHVTGDRNDFATWVEDVLCDYDCASSLRTAKTPKTAKTVVARFLKLYKY
jgi:hypothetical protein